MDYVYGLHSVLEAIYHGKEFDRVFIKNQLGRERAHELIKLLKDRDIPFQFVPVEKLNRMSSGNHQGIIGLVSIIEYSKLENIIPAVFERGEDPFIIVLDEITDVRNLGAIARTAEFAGLHAILIPSKGSAQINADAIKTSSGALHKVAVCRSDDLKKSILFMKESGLQIVAGTEKAEKTCFKADLSGPLALVMGSEEKGISKEILQSTDQLVAIPRHGGLGSLNVSVAAGILCYEVLRQRLAAGS